MLKSNTAVAGASCTPTLYPELKICPNPECGQPFTGPELTCSFHCATAYAGFTTIANEFAGVVGDAKVMFLSLSEQPAYSAKEVALRLASSSLAEGEPTYAFNPSAWAASHLDLLHPPIDEDYQKLGELTISELKSLYQMLIRDYAHDDWPDFVWDILSNHLQGETSALTM